MATRANRAATAANKKGGRSRRRNTTVQGFDTTRGLDKPRNRRVFEAHKRETVARMRNDSTGIPTRRNAYGIPLDQETFTPRGRPGKRQHPSKRQKLTRAMPVPRRKGRPSGRGISGDQIFITGTRVSASGKLDASRERPPIEERSRLASRSGGRRR